MEENLTDLQRLLRLKRHEAPSPEFMEDFLFEFHQRQRAELLKRPLWRLALDRFEGALPGLQLPRYAYATACGVAIIFAGSAANRILTSPVSTGPVSIAASAPVEKSAPKYALLPAPPRFFAPAPQSLTKTDRLDIYSRPTVTLAELDFDTPRYQSAGSPAGMRNPRYVLEAQPVSYAQGENF